jgi:RNA polymerase sigma-70 factor (ECF subfamily)
MAKRTNEEWLAQLRGPDRDAALGDLRALLIDGLRYAMASRSAVTEIDLEDFAQEALLKVLAGLDTFRGESQFTTWAQKIAVRVALTELRRQRWRDVSLEDVAGSTGLDILPDMMVDSAVGPARRALQHTLLATLRRTINEELTDRQRQALVAVTVQGMPLEEVARRMGTSRNALYKLLHDARLRLKNRLVSQGMSAEDILEAFAAQPV